MLAGVSGTASSLRAGRDAFTSAPAAKFSNCSIGGWCALCASALAHLALACGKRQDEVGLAVLEEVGDLARTVVRIDRHTAHPDGCSGPICAGRTRDGSRAVSLCAVRDRTRHLCKRRTAPQRASQPPGTRFRSRLGDSPVFRSAARQRTGGRRATRPLRQRWHRSSIRRVARSQCPPPKVGLAWQLTAGSLGRSSGAYPASAFTMASVNTCAPSTMSSSLVFSVQ